MHTAWRYYLQGDSSAYIVEDSDKTIIVRIPRVSGNEEKIARLIASAPDLLELLSIMFDAYENGVPCYEDPEEEYNYMGNVFKLNDEHFNRIAELLNALAPRDAKATGKEG